MNGLAATHAPAFNMLADLASDALIAVDSGRITYSNPAAQRLFCGTAAMQPLEGTTLEALCEPCPTQWLARQPVWARLLDGHMKRLDVRAAPGAGAAELLLCLREAAATESSGPPQLRQELLDRLLSGLDMTDDGVFLIHRATMRYLDFNEGACRLLGYSREELMRRTADQASPSEAGFEQLAAVYDDVIAHAPATRIAEIDVRRSDGGIIVCEVRYKPVRHGDSWIIAATLRDITDRKLTQARMERFATALDMSGDGVFLIDRESMRYVDVNHTACALLNYSREEMLHRKPHEAPLREYSEEQLAAEYDRVIAQAPATVTQEVDFARRDGSIVTCEVRRQAIRSDSGWMIVANCRDVSQRKAVQARMDLFGSAMNASSDCILLIDRERMGYIDANEAASRLFGIGREELLRARPWEISPYPVSREELIAEFDALIAAFPHPDNRQRIVRTRDGAVKEAYDARRQALFIGGRWVILVTARDVTQQLRERSRTELFANVLNLISDTIAVIDRASMTYVDVNPALCTFLGVPREELVGHGLVNRLADSPEQLAAAYDNLIRNAPASDERDLPYQRPGGVPVIHSVRRQAMHLDGRWVIVVWGRDVTDRKAFQARVQLLARAVNSSADRIYFVDRERMEFIDGNDATLKHHGVGTIGELRDIKPWDAIRHGPMTQAELESSYDQVIAQAPLQHQTMQVWRDPGGAILDAAEITRNALLIEGRWIIVITWHDMTEHLRQQARMQLFATALDLSADAVFLVDRESMKVLDINQTACDLLGSTREELLSRPLDGFSSEFTKVREMAEAYDRAIAQSPIPYVMELSMRRADGTTVPCEVRRQAMRSGKRWIIVATARDITERKEARARSELLALAMNASSDHVAIIDPETARVIDANESALKFHGLERDEALALPFFAPVPGSTHAEMMKVYQHAVHISPEPDRLIYVSSGIKSGKSGVFDVRRQALKVHGRWLILATATEVTERQEHLARIERLAAATELSEDGVVLIDSESGEVLYANEATARLLGTPISELVGSLGGALALLGSSFDEVIRQSPVTLTAESIVVAATGRETPCEVRRQAVRSGDRWIIVATARDITERKKVQARNELLAAAMNNSSDYIVIVDPQTRTVVDANEAALQFHGMRHSEILGISSSFATPQFTLDELSRRYKSVIDAWPEPLRTVHSLTGLRTGVTGHFELRRQALSVEGRWLIVATGQNVTERQEHLARIERFAAVMELGEDAVTMIESESCQILYANEATARLLGASREELMASSNALVELGPAFGDVVGQSPATLVAEVTVRRADGRAVPCEVRRQAIFSQDRWIIVSMMRNISERRAAEEAIRHKVLELTRSNQELEQFAYVTSHDLSEPLRMVASYTQLLERRYVANFDEEAREFMGYIVGGAQRMKQLIDDLLMYSRTGRPNIQTREFALDRALDDALANLAHALRNGGATVERQPLPVIVGDKSGMVQVFQNLIGNAIKFHRPNVPPLIRIEAGETGGHWHIAVRDNGIGIAPEYFERIFVIFQRLHPRESYEGTGIGLAICKKVVDRHDGQIAVESRPGEGATFRIRLPKAPGNQ